MNLHERDYCNTSTYLRFIILDLLKHYDKAIYLDCDIIVNHDLADLYSIDIGNNYVAACRDIPMSSRCNTHNNEGKKYYDYIKNELKLTNVFDYFCAGIMIFNIKEMTPTISTKYLFDIALSKPWIYQDQDVLNMVCKDKVYFLDLRWDCFSFHKDFDEKTMFYSPKYLIDEYLQAKKDPYIIHYAGQMQPIYQPEVTHSQIYWNIFKKSPFYFDMIIDLIKIQQKAANSIYKKSSLKEKIKSKFPPNTFMGKMLRKIAYLFKRKK